MQGEVVVDAYAGVGYYTFPMLVHAGQLTCMREINPSLRRPPGGCSDQRHRGPLDRSRRR